MLLVVLLLVDDNITINEKVIEQVKLSWLSFFTTHFSEHTFTNKYSSRYTERVSSTAKA